LLLLLAALIGLTNPEVVGETTMTILAVDAVDDLVVVAAAAAAVMNELVLVELHALHSARNLLLLLPLC